MYILGVSAFYHDSAATLIKDGKIIAAAEEEKFSRIKHDNNFPIAAIKACLDIANISIYQVDQLVFYEKPFVKFERIIETYIQFAPKGVVSFVKAMKTWIGGKIHLRKRIISEIHEHFDIKIDPKQISFSGHHLSHAASAYYPSPFTKAAIMVIDGVGEWSTTSLWIGEENKIIEYKEIEFPNSIGLLYSAFTYYCGFKVNSGEYKLMGLAPYGSPRYEKLILDNLVDIKIDGSFKLNIDFFDFNVGSKMINEKFEKLFNSLARKPESEITDFYKDIAASIQKVTEDLVFKITEYLYKETQIDSLVMAGGVALNCVSNGRLLERSSFKNIWIQPAASDAGGSLGAAFLYWHMGQKEFPATKLNQDLMQLSYLGTSISQEKCKIMFEQFNLKQFKRLDDEELIQQIIKVLLEERTVAVCRGRMEFGPRALGNRSILAIPYNYKMKEKVNSKIKFRESFRPFAPMIRKEDSKKYIGFEMNSPYMLFTTILSEEVAEQIPAVVHVDNSARIQTVSEDNIFLKRILDGISNKDKPAVLLNTSFNLRGEPIVCNEWDAFMCFLKSELDVLILENYILYKEDVLDLKIKVTDMNHFKIEMD